jgi:hypothetical protein
MARRILSAESALMPPAQASLAPAGRADSRPDARGGFFSWLHERWSAALGLPAADVLFDWDDRTALMQEIAFVNESRERLDEAVFKLAPSMLRIVLTVKAHVEEPQAQRAFLAEHLSWDFRRISELCIVADSYGLLEPDRREAGRREIARYGWSSALKLAYVRDSAAREEIWERAGGGGALSGGRASYRDVLEELRRFRERKLIGPPASESEVHTRWQAVRERFDALAASAEAPHNADACREALTQLAHAQRELNRLKRALQERMQAAETEALAETA